VWTDALKQMLGTEYSYVGRYQKALDCFDRPFGRPKKTGQLVSPEQYESCDAVAAILELADKRQVIMINEAHHVPMHRAFTLQLLEGLYRKGFRYFAAETLVAGDTTLETRGYPILRYYLAEPIYADLVRTALNLGFKIVPYEFTGTPGVFEVADPIPGMNAREQGQARNLKERILDKDPTAKIIVHAGYSHICKSPDNRGKGEVRWMALAFQELTGIEPFSIDQTQMSESNKRENENRDYRFAVENGLVKDGPVVLRDKQGGGFFVCTSNGLTYDLSVIHPRSRFEHGRPTWLAMGGRRQPHEVQTTLHPPSGGSYLAQAFFTKEMASNAVPIDQIEYSADEAFPTLWLPAGEIQVRIVDDEAKILHEYKISDQ
jgi:hypothetical protein